MPNFYSFKITFKATKITFNDGQPLLVSHKKMFFVDFMI
jgi:hypothetical protein